MVRRSAALTGALVVVVSVLLAGCLEVVQHVGTGPGGTLENYVRVTLQRGVFDFAAAMGGETKADEDLANEFGLTEQEIVSGLPPSAVVRYEPVSTEFDFGFALRTTTPRTLRADGAVFIPQLSAGELRIELPPGNEESDGEATFFLSSAKYRIIVDKALMPTVGSAHVLTSEGASSPIDVTELQSVWLLEFPVLFWLTGGVSPVIIIRA